jgi:hypothetical protein
LYAAAGHTFRTFAQISKWQIRGDKGGKLKVAMYGKFFNISMHLLLARFCALFLFSNDKSIRYKRYENVYLYYEWCKLNDKVNAYLLGLSKMKPSRLGK